MNWIFVGVLVFALVAWMRSAFTTLYVSLVVAGTEIITGSMNLVELMKTSKAGNKIFVRDDPGIKLSAYFVGFSLHFDVALDVGIGGVRLTKTWTVNVGSLARFIGKGETFRLMESPVTVDLNVRIGT